MSDQDRRTLIAQTLDAYMYAVYDVDGEHIPYDGDHMAAWVIATLDGAPMPSREAAARLLRAERQWE